MKSKKKNNFRFYMQIEFNSSNVFDNLYKGTIN